MLEKKTDYMFFPITFVRSDLDKDKQYTAWLLATTEAPLTDYSYKAYSL